MYVSNLLNKYYY